jgi:hypothetical protein
LFVVSLDVVLQHPCHNLVRNCAAIEKGSCKRYGACEENSNYKNRSLRIVFLNNFVFSHETNHQYSKRDTGYKDKPEEEEYNIANYIPLNIAYIMIIFISI